jgi:hypothetical protein
MIIGVIGIIYLVLECLTLVEGLNWAWVKAQRRSL